MRTRNGIAERMHQRAMEGKRLAQEAGPKPGITEPLHPESLRTIRQLVKLHGLHRIRAILQQEKSFWEEPAPYDCKLCGQRINDGHPCGCGARGAQPR